MTNQLLDRITEELLDRERRHGFETPEFARLFAQDPEDEELFESISPEARIQWRNQWDQFRQLGGDEKLLRARRLADPPGAPVFPGLDGQTT